MRALSPLFLALLATAPGCGQEGESAGDAGVSGAPEGGGAGGGSGLPVVGSSTVTGLVVDSDDEPVAALSVTLCGTVCRIEKTDEQGRFAFDGIASGVKVIEAATVPPGDDFTLAVRSWTRFFDFVTVGDNEDISIERPFRLHRVANAVGPLTGVQNLPLTAELGVAFDADAISEEGPLPAGADSVWLGAVDIPKDDWPRDGLRGWTVLAVWGLAIWDLETVNGYAVTATLPTALSAGSEVAFLVADYEFGFTEGHFYEEAAELSEDGAVLRTPPGAGLDRATRWLAVTRSP
jgi:hypothetical protein